MLILVPCLHKPLDLIGLAKSFLVIVKMNRNTDHYVLETYFMLKQVLKADNKSPVATGGPAPPIASRKSYYKMIQCSRNIVNQS